MKERIKIVKKFIIEECLVTINSITYPIIKTLNFKAVHKQYKNKKNCAEYRNFLKGEKAYLTIIELEKELFNKK